MMHTISQPINQRISPADLEEFCVQAMVKSGLRDADARITADVLVTTDTWGVHTHGTKQLRPLLKNIRQGRLNAQAEPEITGQGSSWAIVDGHICMPPATSAMAMKLAIHKARETGVAYVGVKHSGHFGAAGYYAVMAAQEGMIGLAMCNVDPGVTVPGAKGRVLGTNPIAFAVPAGKEKPVFLDIATSAVAASKLYAAQALGKPIPENWLVDDDGLPTTDPTGYPHHGALFPMAGHKGYGLALLVEVLTGVLTGASMTSQVVSWIKDIPDQCNQGHAFIAIDVGSIIGYEEFARRMEWVIRFIKESPKAKGSSRIYLPGEMEWERREDALAHGIPLPQDVAANLVGVAEDIGMGLELLSKPARAR
ncbi:MAG: Ldh family oxidoreductase [Candidatus Omnitrophica bacterium]|nr:Ldh family oxidoreductase [Candidatus Omnitrophota bacterium]